MALWPLRRVSERLSRSRSTGLLGWWSWRTAILCFALGALLPLFVFNGAARMIGKAADARAIVIEYSPRDPFETAGKPRDASSASVAEDEEEDAEEKAAVSGVSQLFEDDAASQPTATTRGASGGTSSGFQHAFRSLVRNAKTPPGGGRIVGSGAALLPPATTALVTRTPLPTLPPIRYFAHEDMKQFPAFVKPSSIAASWPGRTAPPPATLPLLCHVRAGWHMHQDRDCYLTMLQLWENETRVDPRAPYCFGSSGGEAGPLVFHTVALDGQSTQRTMSTFMRPWDHRSPWSKELAYLSQSLFDFIWMRFLAYEQKGKGAEHSVRMQTPELAAHQADIPIHRHWKAFFDVVPPNVTAAREGQPFLPGSFSYHWHNRYDLGIPENTWAAVLNRRFEALATQKDGICSRDGISHKTAG